MPNSERVLAKALPPDFNDDCRSVVSSVGGFIQSIDLDGLFRVACEQDLVVRVEGRIGDFVRQSGSLVVAHPYGRVSDGVVGDLRSMFSFGPERTPQYDVESSLRRIVEVAQRALSPGINDPTTELYCLDRLGEALGLLSDRHMPSGRIVDRDQKLRVIFEPVSFADLACPAFAAIARYGIRDDDLVARLLDVMERCSRGGPSPDREKVTRLHGMNRTDRPLGSCSL